MPSAAQPQEALTRGQAGAGPMLPAKQTPPALNRSLVCGIPFQQRNGTKQAFV